jgi:hypothetical protein
MGYTVLDPSTEMMLPGAVLDCPPPQAVSIAASVTASGSTNAGRPDTRGVFMVGPIMS